MSGGVFLFTGPVQGIVVFALAQGFNLYVTREKTGKLGRTSYLINCSPRVLGRNEHYSFPSECDHRWPMANRSLSNSAKRDSEQFSPILILTYSFSISTSFREAFFNQMISVFTHTTATALEHTASPSSSTILDRLLRLLDQLPWYSTVGEGESVRTLSRAPG